MNKYIKLLALSGSILSAVGLTAIDVSKNKNNDVNSIYQNVEKMQNIIPRLSRVNYKLNVDFDNTEQPNQSTLNDEQTDNNVTESQSGEIDNVTFTTTDDNGMETNIKKEESLTYLSETLEQTNIEYENLKSTLNEAIKDTMDYLEKYKNGEIELTNEQKLYIKEHTNSIKFLAETLEDLSEDVICAIDDCCDEDIDEVTGKYIKTINDLETRIYALQNAITSLQFINNISNPYFSAGGRYVPNHIIYGLHYSNSVPKLDNDNSSEDDKNIEDGSNIEDNAQEDTLNSEVDNINNDTDSTNNNTSANIDILEIEQDNTNVDDSEQDKPTTFGLKSNIDTYAPTKRNIDTFFNTALLDNDYYGGGMGYNGYGYGMPYGNAGNFGYGYPYGAGFGNPYAMNGYNSNMINREVANNQFNSPASTVNAVANVDNNSSTKDAKSKKVRAKRAKNVDTYKGVTIQSNINSMGESKISKFFKEKFNTLRSKIRKQKDNINENKQNFNQNIEDQIDNSIPNQVENNVNNNNLNNQILDNTLQDNQINLGNMKDLGNNIDELNPLTQVTHEQEKQQDLNTMLKEIKDLEQQQEIKAR